MKAKALLQLAIAYDTIGKQSLSLYEQIVRDFKDQPAFNAARTRLDALRPPTPPSTVTMRKIEFGDTVQNVVATDGQALSIGTPIGGRFTLATSRAKANESFSGRREAFQPFSSRAISPWCFCITGQIRGPSRCTPWSRPMAAVIAS